jgi:beta-glucanase (GH16 family)
MTLIPKNKPLNQFIILLSILCLSCGQEDPIVFEPGALKFEDNFDGSNLNATKWTHQTGTGSQYGLWGWGNGELQYYRAENTTVSDGTAKIRVQNESYGGKEYTSSRFTTNNKFTFRYGKVQARIKTVKGKSLWPAFWLLPAGGNWPCDGEIDIMEQGGNVGGANQTTGAAHLGNCPGNSTYKTFDKNNPAGVSYADDFHIYEIQWSKDKITWYVDDEKVYQVTPENYPGQDWPFNRSDWYIIINLAIDKSGPNQYTQLPSEMEIDWVRVYELEQAN